MTHRLEQAFRAVAQLSPAEQDALAEVILAEVGAAEAQWDQRFSDSAETLGTLADEALAEHRRSKTRKLDPNEL